MKKKIVFTLPCMLARGVEKSILNLISEIDKEKYDITFIFVEAKGEFLDLIPSYVHIKEINASCERKEEINTGKNSIVARRCFNEKNYKEFLNSVIRSFEKRIRNSIYDISLNGVIKELGEYDLAVCYHIHCPFLIYYTRRCIEAKKYVAWIHNDIISSGFDIKKFEAELNRYDNIFCVSTGLYDEVVKIVPTLKNRTSIFFNILNTEEIRRKALEDIPDEMVYEAGIKIVSVGALEKQKGFDLAIRVSLILKKAGYCFLWLILGEGTERSNLEQQIREYGLDNYLILCGTKENPYNYMENADIYAQTSRHEGYCITLAEARCLNKPIITTDFTGGREQIKDKYTGSVVGFNEGKFAKELMALIDSVELREKYISNLKIENRLMLKTDVTNLLGIID